MQIVKAKYEGKDNVLTIKPSGDWHVGHVNYTEPLVLDWVNSLNENTRGLLMGKNVLQKPLLVKGYLILI